MLHFTRWKALAIVLASAIICLLMAPSLLSEEHFRKLPSFLRHRMVRGLDLQGASHLLLEVDSAAVRKEKVETLRDDVRRSLLREPRIGYTNLSISGQTVSVRVRDQADAPKALTRLRELSNQIGGLLSGSDLRDVDVVDASNGLIQLTLTNAGITQRIRQAVEQAIEIVRRRVDELGTVEPLIQRQGLDRILLQVPGLQDPARLKALLGQT